jgi:peroxiredoxin
VRLPIPGRAHALLLLLFLSSGAPGLRAAEPQPPLGLAPWKRGATPPLALEDLSGEQVKVAGLRGKTVVLNFWATWCESCRTEMASLQRLRESLAGAAVAVLTVDVGESRSRVQSFLEEAGIKLPVLLDGDGAAARRWQVVGLPTSFVLGPDGRIRYYFVGELDWMREDVVRTVASLQPPRARAPPSK